METELDFGDIELVLEQIMGKSPGFEKMVAEVIRGEGIIHPFKWIEILTDTLMGQLKIHGQSMGYLCILIISAAVLAVIARAFRNKQISDMGFYMIFLLLFLILMKSFGICYELTASVILELTDFMKVLMPAYLMAAAMGAYSASAIVYYEGFLFLIYYIHKFVTAFLLPATKTYVLIGMLGCLGKEERLSKGREGLKKLILFALKAIIGGTAGIQMIQGMITPAIDEMKHTVVSKGVSSLGSIGNVAQNVTDVILGSGALLKNGIGAVASVLIVSICLIPVIEVAGYVVFYHVLAAAAEPISDRRLVQALDQAGEGMELLVKLLFTVCAIFLLTIAIVCATTGGIG